MQITFRLGQRRKNAHVPAPCYFLRVPIARVLVFALALTHAVGLADLVVGDACEELCQDDGCAGDCLPGAACRCHCPSAMAAIGSVHAVAKSAPPEPIDACTYHELAHASPDPREILRVPKLSA